MTKEEARLSVMGAISMALKDPTLQQGFEIICKNLAKLEKENAELKAVERMALYSKMSDQLAKAKKIIKDLCGMVRELNKPNVQLTNIDYSLSEAEQFINEVEK